jgi:uncharacterized phage protein (TIGR02220 family)
MTAKNFTQIRNDIIRNDSLTPHEKAVLSVILSYGSCEKIYISQAVIAKESNMSRDMVHRIIKKLKKEKYINTVIQPDRATLEYELLSKAVTDGISKVTDEKRRGYGQERQGGTDEDDTSNKSISNKSIVIKKKIKKKDDIPYQEIIDYLNTKLNKKNERGFQLTEATKSKIKTCWGFASKHPEYKDDPIKAFFYVIDVKCEEWGNKTEWQRNLNPATLFQLGKIKDNFAKYLAQTDNKTISKEKYGEWINE